MIATVIVLCVCLCATVAVLVSLVLMLDRTRDTLAEARDTIATLTAENVTLTAHRDMWAERASSSVRSHMWALGMYLALRDHHRTTCLPDLRELRDPLTIVAVTGTETPIYDGLVAS